MSSTPFSFRVDARDPLCRARSGAIHTPHGEVPTPAFCPVGTAGSVRAMTPWDVKAAGASMVLANTYHLALRPGEALIEKAGGVHRFMGWDGPILTDSGGFQVFSLKDRFVSDEGVRFRTPDGEIFVLTPERAVEIQEALGSDIAMILDECVGHPCEWSEARAAVERTTRWAERALAAHRRRGQVLFGIVQGSVYPDLRERAAEQIVALDFPGYAIGGVSVGEGFELLRDVVGLTAELLPEDRPRYVMGVGLPEDLLACIERGADLFDCVIPTRFGRGGTLFTRRGAIRIRHRRYRSDLYPIDRGCSCAVCGRFSRAYLHHLFEAHELLGPILATYHNVAFYQDLMAGARAAIVEGRLPQFGERFLAEYRRGGESATRTEIEPPARRERTEKPRPPRRAGRRDGPRDGVPQAPGKATDRRPSKPASDTHRNSRNVPGRRPPR